MNWPDIKPRRGAVWPFVSGKCLGRRLAVLIRRGQEREPAAGRPVVGGGAGGSYDSGKVSPGRGVHMACATEHAKQGNAEVRAASPEVRQASALRRSLTPRRPIRASAVDRGTHTKA